MARSGPARARRVAIRRADLRGLPAVYGGAVLTIGALSAGAIYFHRYHWPVLVGTLVAAAIAALVLAPRLARERRYRTLLNRVPVGLYRTTPDGRLIDVNPALARSLGCDSPDALAAASAESFYADPKDRARWMARIDAAKGSVDTELRVRRMDGTVIWVRDRVVPVRDRRGRILYYEGELEDITEQKRSREQLEAALRSKIEFIGTVSHELRTPLTSLLGFARLLSDGEAIDDAERREMLAVVEQQAEDLVGIVEDLLTAAQADAGSLTVSPRSVDLGEEVHKAVAGLERRHNGTLDVRARPSPAQADPIRVRQIVRNLVTNAIAHGGLHIRLVVGAEDHQAWVSIADDGPGLAPDDVGRVFQPFQQGTQHEARPGSAGLGLSISRHLARAMGGELAYHRRDGETIFHLTLPAAEPSPPAQPPPAASPLEAQLEVAATATGAVHEAPIHGRLAEGPHP